MRSVLVSKGKGAPDAASSYRPHYLLDRGDKLLEKLLRPWLQEQVRAAGDLSIRLYGFITVRSTSIAVQEVVVAALLPSLVPPRHLDVKDAFNSVRWYKLLESMKCNFRLPHYLQRILRDD